MKKSLISIFGVLTLFAACTKESEISGIIVPEGKELVKITAIAESSRTTVDIDGACANYAWNFGDTLAVVEEDGTDFSKFSLVDAATGTFAGVKTEGKSLMFAVTPASCMVSGIDVEGQLQEFTISLPDFYDEYIPGTTNAVMFGTPAEVQENGYKFNFSHAAAVVKISYKNVPVGTAGLRLTMDKSITGSWTFDALDNVVLTTTPQGSNSVWLQLKEPVRFFNQELDFYVPVPVGEYSSFDVVLFDEKFEEIIETKRSKNASTTLERGELFTTPVITLLETSLEGSYIIVSKAATKDYWVVMEAQENGNGRWNYSAAGTLPYYEEINLFDSSQSFPYQSNISYKFDVVQFGDGYVLRNAKSGKYIQLANSGNAGKEVDEEDKAAFDVFKINADGTWTIGSWRNDTDFFSLQYNVGNYFTFYKSAQAKIYLIPYVGQAMPVMLSGVCIHNKVTLIADPSTAEIRYTVDGSEPDLNATPYEGPFSISASCTVKAIAYAPNSDYTDSDIFELECTYVEPGTTAYYEKVTTAPDDWCGEYLMVCENQNLALSSISTTQTKYGIGSSVDIADGEIEASDEVDQWKITVAEATNQGTGYTFYLTSASAFLSWSAGNSLASNATESDNTRWTITAGATAGNWVIANVKDSTREIWYNTNSPRFACYTGKNESSSGYAAIQLYKLSDGREALETPDGLSVDGMTISWSPVNNAETYTVTVGSTVASVQSTSYTYEGETGYYDVYVVAVPASGSSYRASKPAMLGNVQFGTPTLPAPELSAGICTTNSVQVTWTADERATSGYHASIGVTGAPAEIESKDVTEGSVTFDGLESGTEYTVWVYANAVEGDQPWEASQSTSIEVSTTQGSTTIADAITACPSNNFTLTGVTVVGVASASNVLIGDGTGFALVYKSNHGLALGDVINVSGATTRYKGVVEFNQPAVEKTGTAPAVAYGDPVSPTADMMQAWAAGDFDITYIQATGTQSGRNVTLANGYVLYLYKANAATDGKGVSVSGLVYGWDSGHSNFNFFFTSIEEDASAPSLEVTPLSKTWAYNDTTPAEFSVTAKNGTWDYNPKTLEWVTISRTDNGLTVTPKGENSSEDAYQGIITVSLTPTDGSPSIYKEIVLTQNKNNGGGGGDTTEETIDDGTFSGDVNSIAMTTNSGITITQLKNGGTNVNTTYNTVSTLRVYRANQLSFTGKTFTKIEMYYTGTYSGADWGIAAGNGTVSIDTANKKVVWENSNGASTVTLQNSTASGNNVQLRTTKFVVTY